MRYLSVCSGIEAATVAWHPLGWAPVAFSEIEAFPRSVLAHNYPHVPLHGDFTTIKGDEYGAVDLLVGGTPCQSFSASGARKGLADPRGNLMLEYGSLAERLGAEWLVWENVAGALSTNGGRDFGSFLGMLAELGYGFAYRVLDAQYFGVPQRRRRVFVVANRRDWRLAAAALFERQGLQKDHVPRIGPWQDHAAGIIGGFDAELNGHLAGQPTGPLLKGSPTGGGKPYPAIILNRNGEISVRRLSIVEKERLQGFPDHYTAVSFNGKAAGDTHRARALGNSMAVPVMAWIGQRIDQVEAIRAGERAAA